MANQGRVFPKGVFGGLIMKMWIARDEDGLLNLFFEEEPYRKVYERIIVWTNEWGDVGLDEELFPEVTFENSPMEVELKLIEK